MRRHEDIFIAPFRFANPRYCRTIPHSEQKAEMLGGWGKAVPCADSADHSRVLARIMCLMLSICAEEVNKNMTATEILDNNRQRVLEICSSLFRKRSENEVCRDRIQLGS